MAFDRPVAKTLAASFFYQSLFVVPSYNIYYSYTGTRRPFKSKANRPRRGGGAIP